MSDTKRVFTYEEMENIFEIGREIQYMFDHKTIEIEDSKEAFLYALQLAIEFEENFHETDDYYSDLYYFIVDKVADRFGVGD